MKEVPLAGGTSFFVVLSIFFCYFKSHTCRTIIAQQVWTNSPLGGRSLKELGSFVENYCPETVFRLSLHPKAII
jgi:hypothetical protein